MVLIKIKETKINSNGQITIPVHFKRNFLPDNSAEIYQTIINGVNCLIIAPKIIENQSENLKKIQEKQ